MVDRLLRPTDAAELIGCSADTLRRASDRGVLPVLRSTGRGDRRYRESDLWAYIGANSQADVRDRVEAHYVRVSGSDQKTSLADQKTLLATSATGPVFKVYSDVGSGLNSSRKQLTQLMADAKEGKFTVVRVTYADRLTRFGLEYLQAYFTLCDVELEILEDKRFKSSHEELTDDLLSLIASFSGKFYKMRSVENKRKVVAELTARLQAESV